MAHQSAEPHCPKYNLNFCKQTAPVMASADETVHCWSGLDLDTVYIWLINQTYTDAFVPTVTGLVFMRRFRLFFRTMQRSRLKVRHLWHWKSLWADSVYCALLYKSRNSEVIILFEDLKNKQGILQGVESLECMVVQLVNTAENSSIQLAFTQSVCCAVID